MACFQDGLQWNISIEIDILDSKLLPNFHLVEVSNVQYFWSLSTLNSLVNCIWMSWLWFTVLSPSSSLLCQVFPSYDVRVNDKHSNYFCPLPLPLQCQCCQILFNTLPPCLLCPAWWAVDWHLHPTSSPQCLAISPSLQVSLTTWKTLVLISWKDIY